MVIVNKLLLLFPLVAIASIFSVYLFENLSMTDNVALYSTSQGFMRGHIEVIASNENGVFSYSQSDNKIVTHGENCMAKMLFGAAGGDEAGTVVCDGAINVGWNFIGLGETGEATKVFVDGDTGLRDPADSAGLSANVAATVTWTNSTGGSFATILLSNQFTNTGATEVVNEAALFNGTAGANTSMFAGNNFANVTLNNGDDITINWTVEIGEATVP